MINKVFFILMFIHILGDFYFQSDKLSKFKDGSFRGIISHSIIYLLSSFCLVFITLDKRIIYAAIISSLMHFIIDLIKYWYLITFRNKYPVKDSNIYVIDQILHIFTFAIISLIITMNNTSINKPMLIVNIFSLLNISPYQTFKWTILILIIGKPANITIKKLLNTYKPSEKIEEFKQEYKEEVKDEKSKGTLVDGLSEVVLSDDETQQDAISNDKKAGSFIGFLERFIILIFLSINQYSAIGLILTAKSIARYDRISKDQEFAEYYLLGTLLSVIIVLVAFFIVMK